MASSRKRSAGERVLEGRHVIGLFLLMLLFSAVFFSLGYVMARNQYAGQVRADGGKDGFLDPPVVKPEISPKRAAGKAGAANSTNSTNSPGEKTSSGATSASSAPPVAASDWEIFTEKPQKSENHLKAPAPATTSSVPKVSSANNAGNTNSRPAPAFSDSSRAAHPSGGYTLQVIAVRRQADAMDLARRLQKKRFPAFVLSPQGNKLYRVQVGPYADQKSAEAAKKGLENAGFRAIVKHG